MCFIGFASFFREGQGAPDYLPRRFFSHTIRQYHDHIHSTLKRVVSDDGELAVKLKDGSYRYAGCTPGPLTTYHIQVT